MVSRSDLLILWANRILRHGLLIYAPLPILLMGIFLWQKAIVVPVYEDLYVVQPIIMQARAGEFPLQALVRPYNGQRHVLPMLIEMLLALISGWDVRVNLLFNLVVVAVIVALVFAVWRMQRLPTFTGAVPALLLALLLTPTQYINFIFGFQVCIWLMMLGVYGSAFAAARWPGRTFAWALSGLGTFVAAWSFLGGHVLWIAVPIGLWLAGERRWRPFIIWAGFAALNIGLYLTNYTLSDTPVEIAPPLLANGRVIVFPLTFLGGPFSGSINPLLSVAAQDTTQSALIGLIGVVLLIALLASAAAVRTLDLRRTAPWLMLILFSLGSAAMITLGRALEPKDTITSRYTTMALPFWIGLVGLAAQALPPLLARPRWRSGTIALTAALLPVLLGTFALTFLNFTAFDTRRDRMLQCVLTFDGPDCASVLIGEDAALTLGSDLVIERVGELRRERLSVFRLPALVDLRAAAIQTPPGAEPGARWEVYPVDGAVVPVLLMPPPAQASLQIYVPDALHTVELTGAIYLPHPQFISGNADRRLADGADFSLAVVDEAGRMQTVFTGGFDPTAESDPTPFTVDLTPYRGQIIALHFVTAARANPDYDWAMWVDPRLQGS
jgi:hypothetical protein